MTEHRFFCECSDPGCDCGGQCMTPADITLVRVDIDDLEGTRFCDVCADDAFESGLFTAVSTDEE